MQEDLNMLPQFLVISQPNAHEFGSNLDYLKSLILEIDFLKHRESFELLFE